MLVLQTRRLQTFVGDGVNLYIAALTHFLSGKTLEHEGS